MKRLTIILLKIIVNNCKKTEIKLRKQGGGSVIVAQAYKDMIKNYNDSIMFLNAQLK